MTISRVLVLPLAILVMACDAPAPVAKTEAPPAAASEAPPEIPRAEIKPVYAVDSVTVSLELREGAAPLLTIKARGTVRTGGWSNGELRPAETFASEQGVRSFTFVATSPRSDMMVTQALTPIEAKTTMPPLPADVKAIRIIAETNEMTQPLP